MTQPEQENTFGTFVYQRHMLMCDRNAYDALLLSQIYYWDSRKNNGDWVAKNHSDWDAEIGMKERTVRRCLKRLRDSRLIDYQVSGFAGGKTPHMRINWTKYNVMLATFDVTLPDPIGQFDNIPTDPIGQIEQDETDPIGQIDNIPTDPIGQIDNIPTDPIGQIEQDETDPIGQIDTIPTDPIGQIDTSISTSEVIMGDLNGQTFRPQRSDILTEKVEPNTETIETTTETKKEKDKNAPAPASTLVRARESQMPEKEKAKATPADAVAYFSSFSAKESEEVQSVPESKKIQILPRSETKPEASESPAQLPQKTKSDDPLRNGQAMMIAICHGWDKLHLLEDNPYKHYFTSRLYHQFRGTSKKKDAKQYCITPPATPFEVWGFSIWWKRAHKGANIPSSPPKVQMYFDDFRKEDKQLRRLFRRIGEYKLREYLDMPLDVLADVKAREAAQAAAEAAQRPPLTDAQLDAAQQKVDNAIAAFIERNRIAMMTDDEYRAYKEAEYARKRREKQNQ